MTARPKLVPAAAKPAPKPRLRRVTLADAELAYPKSPEHQRRWLRAITVLRTKTERGWKRDHPVQRIPKESQK